MAGKDGATAMASGVLADLTADLSVGSSVNSFATLPVDGSADTSSDIPADSRGARSVKLALRYIEHHFAERIALERLAALAHVSLCRFATVFRSQVGMSPYRYVNTTRIRHAQALLQQGLPASVVAGEVGFCDQSHFSRQFKTHCGMTPGQFAARAKHRGCTNACSDKSCLRSTSDSAV